MKTYNGNPVRKVYNAIGNGTNRVVKVYYCREDNEYIMLLYIAGKLQEDATYFTTDLRDATDTADCMADELLFAELQAIKEVR